MACGTKSGASLGVSIKPAFYQTWWFTALVLLAAVALLWWLIRLRIRSIAHQFQGRLAERVAERERIARELHDTLLQSLFGLTLRFHTAANRLPIGDPAREALDEALKQSDRVMQEGRERVLNLRGRRSDGVNLADALAETGNQLRAIHPANFRVAVEGRPRPLDEIVQEEILLIGREALTNAFSHSGARNIVVEVAYQPGALHVLVRDDGQGIHEGVLKGAIAAATGAFQACASVRTRCVASYAFAPQARAGHRSICRFRQTSSTAPRTPRDHGRGIFFTASARKKAISPQTREKSKFSQGEGSARELRRELRSDLVTLS